ncbi:MAG: DMT family transporter [Bacteroidales bacterium]|nr:DMT family transporter [Bacteroidales bacterium]
MAEKATPKIFVYLAVAVSLFFWGISYIWTDRLVNLGIPVFYFVFLRSALAGLLLLLINVSTGNFQKIGKGDLPKFLLLGFFQPLIYFLAESYGVKETGSPAISSMVIATSPIFTVGAGVLFFREKLTALNILGILIGIGGVCLVLFSKEELGPHYIIGIILLLIAVSSEAGHGTVTKKLTVKYTDLTIVMYQFVFGSLYMVPFFCTLGMKGFEMSWLTSMDVWTPILCLGLFCSGLCFTLWIAAIRGLGLAKAGMTTVMIPVVAALASVILGREHLGAVQWAGIVVAVGGVLMTQQASRKSRLKH